MLDTLKILVGRSDTLTVNALNALIQLASNEFKSYCNRDDIPTAAEATIIEMVLVKYNKMGAEGVNSESFSGTSYSYINGYPDNILQSMKMYRKVRLL